VVLQVPALWMSVMSTRIQEVYSLSVWYNDVLRRYDQLAAWTSGNLATPNSVWLSGLFNPKAFLTAVSLLLTAGRLLLLSMCRRYKTNSPWAMITQGTVLMKSQHCCGCLAGDPNVRTCQQAAA
jgi:hypothetical protein